MSNGMAPTEAINILGKKIYEIDNTLSFTCLEIGALPLEGQTEPFHQLLDFFPQSKIIAFEVDEHLCQQLNQQAKPGITYYPVALGRTEKNRAFYETQHPMCSSLYPPNEKLLSLYHNLEVSMLKSVTHLDTLSIDTFIKEQGIGAVDFIKIDIQGAELEVFQNGIDTLKDTLAIFTEVEFVPLYIDQPLFGDVCQFLSARDFMFHKFQGVAGRTLKPLVINNQPNFPSQNMWSDAIFIKNISSMPHLSSQQLLKLGLLSFIYGSFDVAFHCFQIYDEKNATHIQQMLLGT